MAVRLSIITINLNNKNGLKATLASVEDQLNSDFEYVVVDGDSSDGSKSLIEAHKKRINQYCSEKDHGVYHAMNKGISLSKGDFLLFLNSGDVLYDNTVVDKIVKALGNEDDIVYGDAILRNPTTGSEYPKTHPEELSFSYFYKTTICHQACVIRRQLFETVFYFNESYRICADWEFLICAIFKAEVKYRKIGAIICYYDTSGISGSKAYREISKQERRQTLERYFPLFLLDYEELNSYASYRFKQLREIERSATARKFISIIFKGLLMLIPKKR